MQNIIEKYGDSQPEDIIPSTSDDVRTVNADARIQFSQIIGGLYLDVSDALKTEKFEKCEFQLATLLKSNRTTCTDEYQLLSLQDVASIKNSFEFFILTGVLPFLEPGVGLPASARSSFIKSWKLYDGNKETCAEKVSFVKNFGKNTKSAQFSAHFRRKSFRGSSRVQRRSDRSASAKVPVRRDLRSIFGNFFLIFMNN